MAISKLKNGKATGNYQIPAELIKEGRWGNSRRSFMNLFKKCGMKRSYHMSGNTAKYVYGGYCGVARNDSHSITHITTSFRFVEHQLVYRCLKCCTVVVALLPTLVVTSLGLPHRCWLQPENRVTMWRRAVWSAAGDDVHWMRGWLVVGPQCIAVAAVDVVAGLCGVRQRTVPRCVVPGP
jgi:hypothetical protein